MTKKKLISVLDYILDIDWLTTKEFCSKYNVPAPTIKGGVNDFLQVDAIKQKMFVEYAKFLNKNITEDMFIGENAIFPDFVKCSQKDAAIKGISKSFDNFGKNEFSITILRLSGKEYGQKDKLSYVTSYHLKKINDLVKDGVYYNER